MTNARHQLVVSVAPGDNAGELAQAIQDACKDNSVMVVLEDDAQYQKASDKDSVWNVVELPDATLGDSTKMPMVSAFVSLLFPMGHVKSTKGNDEHFVNVFRNSAKWLRVE